MQIARLETYVLEAKLDKPIQFGVGPYGAFTATLVELTTDDGLVGIGECIARKAPRVTDRVVRDLLWPVVEGRDPQDAGGIWDDMFKQLRAWGHYRGFVQEAMSGVDQAIWDILAQSRGIPVYKALTGAGRDRVPVYSSSVYIADLDTMQRETREQVGKGHVAIKMKVGRTAELGGLRMDIDSVRAVREAAGPDVEIGIDVNSAYDAATAIRFCKGVEQYDITFLEEPVYPDDIDGYEQIRKHTSIPLAGGESEFGIFGFRQLLARRALDIVQPDIARIGGFTAAMRLGALVHAHNVKYAPHTGFSCGVAHLSSLHLAAAVPNLWKLEEMYIANPLMDLFTDGLPRAKSGVVEPPTRPGLGLALDKKRIEHYRLR